MEQIRNYGLDLQKEKDDQRPENWVFGVGEKISGISEGVALINYLPTGEVQRSDKEDMMDCATRSPDNIVETKLNYYVKSKQVSIDNLKWLNDNGYLNDKGEVEVSDAYTSILSGTTRNGNSLIAPLESLRKNGFVPKKLMPLEKWMTWEDYHNPLRITQEIKNIAKESKLRFPINYERVYEKDFDEVREYDMINVAGNAWPKPVNGIYPNPGNATMNHAFCDIPKTPQYTIFDNYIDSVDGDFIKRLASDYNLLDYGYRIVINELIINNNDMVELVRKKGEKRVYLVLNKKRYWIKDAINFNDLKSAQPITNIEWSSVKEVDSFTTPFNGDIIGSANFIDALKELFGIGK